MPKNSHIMEITSTSDNGKVIATVWWNGKKVCCNNGQFLHGLQNEMIGGKTIKDGIAFIEKLPQRYGNGYLSCNKKA